MSWQIPTLIEQDIKSGKAQYRTFQTGVGGQSILPVPANSYIVIFGYDYSPAGGGIIRQSVGASGATQFLADSIMRPFETQQISFYTGTDFYPFIHHVDVKTTALLNNWTVDGSATENQYIQEIDNTTIARQIYITSTNDVAITVGLISTATRVSFNAIPVTSRTPFGLTYGGSPQTPYTQTNFSPAGNVVEFMQPSPKDYQDFAFGLLPAQATDQAFAMPDAVNGLVEPSSFISSIGAAFRNAAGCHYFLNLHYALYTETVPESRG
jgi:hypothetical protein